MGNKGSSVSNERKASVRKSSLPVVDAGTPVYGYTGDAAAVDRELEELKEVFTSITNGSESLEFHALLKIPEVKSQIDEGDLAKDVIEAVWLEAVSMPGGPSNLSPVVKGGGSWGVRTPLGFKGFLELLRLAEERCILEGENPAVSTVMGDMPQEIAVAKTRLVGLLRGTLAVHCFDDHDDGVEGNEADAALHKQSIKAALERSLSMREDRHELERTGILQSNTGNSHMEHELAKARLSRHLKGAHSATREELLARGVLLDQTPTGHALEAQMKRDIVKHTLETRHTVDDLKSSGILKPTSPTSASVERAFITSQLAHNLASRSSPEELKQSGVLHTETAQQQHMDHQLAGVMLNKALKDRPAVEELKEAGVYKTHVEDMAHQLELERTKDALNNTIPTHAHSNSIGASAGLDHQWAARTLKHNLERRPSLDDVKAQGVLKDLDDIQAAAERKVAAAKALEVTLDNRSTVKELKAQGIYYTPNEGKAVELGLMLSKDKLEKELSHRRDISDLKAQGIYHNTQAEISLEHSLSGDKVAAALRARPTYDELAERGLLEALEDPDVLKHAAMKRRQDIMAQQVEDLLNHREPLEMLQNKGIYIKATPQEIGVDRAHVKHVLAGAIAKRADREELVNKGVLLPVGLHEQHRQARNSLEGAFSVRPSIDYLQQQGYLEQDELEPIFAELRGSSGVGPTSSVPAAAVQAWAENRANHVLKLSKNIDVVAITSAVAGAQSVDGSVSFFGFVQLVDELQALCGVEGDTDEQMKQKRLAAKRRRAAEHRAQGFDSLTHMLDGHFKHRRVVSESPSKSNNAHAHADDYTGTNGVMHVPEALENKVAQHFLKQQLEKRPTREELETKGVLLPVGLHEQHRQARNKLEGALSVRPSIDYLQQQGYLEQDELEAVFAGLRSDAGVGPVSPVPSAHVTVWASKHCRNLATNNKNRVDAPQIASAVKAAVSEGTDSVTFLGFVQLVDELQALCGIEGDTDEQMKQNRLAAKRRRAAEHRAKGFTSISSSLESRLQHRPSRDSPETLRIAKDFHTEASVALERHFIASRLSLAMAKRAQKEEEGAYGRGGMGRPRARSFDEPSVSAAAHDLDFKIKSIMLNNLLNQRTKVESEEDLARYEVPVHDDSSFSRGDLARSLSSRGLVTDLKDRGIYLERTPVAHELERKIASDILKHKLEAPGRPTVQQLEASGMLMSDYEVAQKGLSKSLVTRQLRQGLERRGSREDIQARGIYVNSTATQSSHEKLLTRALLSRGLSRHFKNVSSGADDELRELKQKGVYIDLDQNKLRAERNLIASQLSRLMRQRPTKEQIEKDFPKLLEANELALLFDAYSVNCAGEAVSFESLKGWTAVEQNIDNEKMMLEFFQLCDADGDGELSFSEFMRFIDLCDLNPEDKHMAAFTANTNDSTEIDAAFSQFATGEPLQISFLDACQVPIVKRWAESAGISHNDLAAIFNGEQQDLAGFVSFCGKCESLSTSAHNERLSAARAKAIEDKNAAKDTMRNSLIKKLKDRPDYKELKSRHILKEGLEPAAMLLERELIANYLKQQLSARPALSDLEASGIVLPEGTSMQHAEAKKSLEVALAERKEDAMWKARPEELAGGHKRIVSATLAHALERRPSLQEFEQSYVAGQSSTAVAYVALLGKIVSKHKCYKASPHQLIKKHKENIHA